MILFACLKRGIQTSLHFGAHYLGEALKDYTTVQVVEVDNDNDLAAKLCILQPEHLVIEGAWHKTQAIPLILERNTGIKSITIRSHSNMPFMAVEETIFRRCLEILNRSKVHLAFNSREAATSFTTIAKSYRKSGFPKIVYLPNYYPVEEIVRTIKNYDTTRKTLVVGCLGSIRQMKNHVNQAIAAISLANSMKKNLVFHINAGRIQGGAMALQAMRIIFEYNPQHTLVGHEWLDRERMMELIKTFDLATQVSFSETFNYVCADTVSRGIPTVASSEVYWMPGTLVADPNYVEGITDKMKLALDNPMLTLSAQDFLREEVEQSKIAWIRHFKLKEPNA